jgi:glucose-1-phosphate thymidylyltransferase
MKGIVLAGGTGSRLRPLTNGINKHALPVGREPMVFHPVRKLIAAGIREILIVTGAEHMGSLVSTLGSGSDLGADLTYKVQDRAGGIAEALGLARGFTHGSRMVVILGDNIFQDDITPFVKKFEKQKSGARLLLKEVPDPERFGVAEVKGKKIAGIEEKPKKPKSKLCVTGIYMYDEHVFDLVKGLKPSGRGELEITDVNNGYIAKDQLEFDVLDGWWTDAGTFESLARANELVLKGT